ncbi:MAG: hypothetical protein AB1813_27160, partial [Verrucomicrobiota bacterium]
MSGRDRAGGYFKIESEEFTIAESPLTDFRDNFAERRTFSLPEFSASALGADGTPEPGEPPQLGSLWLSWQAPGTGIGMVTGSDASIKAFQGETLSSLMPLPDSEFFGSTSILQFNMQSGETYHIRVALPFFRRFGFTYVPPLSYDAFEMRLPIEGAHFKRSVDFRLATAQANEPLQPNMARTLWFSWTAPNNGMCRLFLERLGAVRAFQGDSLSSLQDLGSTFVATAGTTYAIQVSSGEEWAIPRPFSLDCDEHPANDSVADAEHIPGTHGELAFNTNLATSQPGEPDAELKHTMWFSWLAPQAGVLTLRPLERTRTNTLMRVTAFSGDGVDSLEVLESKPWPAPFNVWVTKNDRIWIRLASALPVFESEGHRLEYHFVPAPPNDFFENAELLTGKEADFTADLHAASRQSEETNLPVLRWGYARTVWWRWVAPQNGSAWIQKNDREVAHIGMAVYTGDSLTNLISVSSQWEFFPSSGVSFRAVAGQTYWFVVATSSEIVDQPTVPLQLRFSEARVVISPADTIQQGTNLLEIISPDTSREGEIRWQTFSLNTYPLWTPAENGLTITNFTPGLCEARAMFTNEFGELRLALPLQFSVRPMNDQFANAYLFGGNSGSAWQRAENATSEPEIENDGMPSLWYKWIAPVSGKFRLLSEFPLQLFRAVNNWERTPVETKPDSFPYDNWLRFDAQAGHTYYFRGVGTVVSFSWQFQTVFLEEPNPDTDIHVSGPIRVRAITTYPAEDIQELECLYDSFTLAKTTEPKLDFLAPIADGVRPLSARVLLKNGERFRSDVATVRFHAANTNFASRQTISGNRVKLYFTGQSPQLWYSWTAPEDGALLLLPAAQVFTNALDGALVEVNDSDESKGFTASVSKANTYHILLTPEPSSTTVVFELFFGSLAPNSSFETRIRVAGETLELLPGASTSATTYPGVWWEWTPPRSGWLYFDVETELPLKPLVLVQRGSTPDSNELGNFPIAAHADEILQLRVVSSANLTFDSLVRMWMRLNEAPNDDFRNALPLRETNVTTRGSLVGATREAGEPIPPLWRGQPSVTV